MIRRFSSHFLTEKEINQLDINQEYLTQVDVITQKCDAELKYHQSLLSSINLMMNQLKNICGVSFTQLKKLVNLIMTSI